MADLKEYLGTLVASVNQARVLADIESASIAEQYAQHRLLKHFSIPRMRMKDIEFTIPVAIEEMQTSEPVDFQPIDNKTFVSRSYDELINAYQVTSFKREVSTPIRRYLFAEADQLEKRLKAGEDQEIVLHDFSDKIAIRIMELKGQSSIRTQDNQEVAITRDYLINKLNQRMQQEIRSRESQNSLERANVIVEAHKLREQKPENMVFIKMKVQEEGMEWHTIEHENGETTSKLLPE
ncbi:MAG: hypothetical protein HRT68_11965 [Flavobacteriaceae bacterium]|nr:hypothetical protein [Flavobacteriaceae bacterium]